MTCRDDVYLPMLVTRARESSSTRAHRSHHSKKTRRRRREESSPERLGAAPFVAREAAPGHQRRLRRERRVGHRRAVAAADAERLRRVPREREARQKRVVAVVQGRRVARRVHATGQQGGVLLFLVRGVARRVFSARRMPFFSAAARRARAPGDGLVKRIGGVANRLERACFRRDVRVGRQERQRAREPPQPLGGTRHAHRVGRSRLRDVSASERFFLRRVGVARAALPVAVGDVKRRELRAKRRNLRLG